MKVQIREQKDTENLLSLINLFVENVVNNYLSEDINSDIVTIETKIKEFIKKYSSASTSQQMTNAKLIIQNKEAEKFIAQLESMKKLFVENKNSDAIKQVVDKVSYVYNELFYPKNGAVYIVFFKNFGFVFAKYENMKKFISKTFLEDIDTSNQNNYNYSDIMFKKFQIETKELSTCKDIDKCVKTIDNMITFFKKYIPAQVGNVDNLSKNKT